MEDMQEQEIMGIESGSNEVEAAPNVQEEPESPNQENAEDPKGIAFGKALAAEKEKIRKELEAEFSEKYKDYDTLKEVSEYFVEANKERGINDVLTLKEQIEMERLQQRAEQNEISPEMQRRLEALETKAAKAEEYERQHVEMQTRTQFETSLKNFCEGKEIGGKSVEHTELWKYMYENQISSPEIAFKAMKADQLEQELADAEKTAVERYLASKKAPKAEGSGSTAFQQPDTAKMSWDDIDRVAAARIRAANQPQ